MNPDLHSLVVPEAFVMHDSFEESIHAGNLEIRSDSRQLLSDSGRVQLTGRELDVLLIFVAQPDRVITRESIYGQVWGGRMPYRDRAVDVYVRRVREKLRTLTPDVTYIHTHFGIGYRFWPVTASADCTDGAV